MRSKGSRFTLGVWGLWARSLDVAFASATVRNRPQPSATVRNRSCEVPMAVPMGSAAKAVNFGGFKRCVTSFHVAGVALCDIPTFFITCRKLFLCDRRNTFGSFSEDDSALWRLPCHFAWQAQHLVQIRRVWNTILRGRRSIWDTLHSTLYTSPSTLYTLYFRLDTPRSTIYTPHCTLTLYTLHVTLRTLHFTLHTLHSTLYTPYSTLYTLNFTRHGPRLTLDTLHSTLYTLHFTLYPPHFTL